MSIRNKRIVLDTNVWIHGLRQDRGHQACSELLGKLRTLQVVIPRQVLVELRVNLSSQEYQSFWQLINSYSSLARRSPPPRGRPRCIGQAWTGGPAWGTTQRSVEGG